MIDDGSRFLTSMEVPGFSNWPFYPYIVVRVNKYPTLSVSWGKGRTEFSLLSIMSAK